MISAGKESDASERALIVHSQQISLESEEADSLVPRSIPIAAVNLKAVAESPRIRASSGSMWTTVDAYVDVNLVEPFDFGYPAPLDVIIILDHV